MEFPNRINLNDINNFSMLSLKGDITPEDSYRLQDIRRFWNFYDGFHYEEISTQDSPEITENYCRIYVDKAVAFEFGRGFTITAPDSTKDVTLNGISIPDFLEDVWDYNSKDKLCIELGQMKSITGDAWVQVKFYAKGTFSDPYKEYPKGKIRLTIVPTSIVFPEFDPHDKNRLVRLVIQYPVKRYERGYLGTAKESTFIYKQEWTETFITTYTDGVETKVVNPYGTIPFIQIPNIPVAGRSYGLSDLFDVIPLNVELNMKTSAVSEIIDYHAAPVTVVFGASIKNLEKGANKIWGGLPKDANVKNLGLESNLDGSLGYLRYLKNSMNEIARVPEGALGGEQNISNTSGVALQFINMPILERMRVKRTATVEGIRQINKLILLISSIENLIKIPDDVDRREFFKTNVLFGDALPKDSLLELQLIQAEMQLGIEDRKGAMQRMGRTSNIEERLAEIDKDREAHPEIYALDTPKINSGVMNGETAKEIKRKETTGKNG